jgi:hypothetical protein
MSRKNIKKYFKLIEHDATPNLAVEVTKGPFRGAIYAYREVSVVEEEEKESAVLQFDYFMLEHPQGIEASGTKEFENLVGDVLVHLIDNNVDPAEEVDEVAEG